MDETDSSQPRRPGLLAAVVLSLLGPWLAVTLTLGALCLGAGTPLLLLYTLVGLAGGLATGVAVWTRQATRRRRAGLAAASCAVGALGVVLPWPRGVSGEPLVRDRALPGHWGGPPLFGGVPEGELVQLGAWTMALPAERESTVRPGLFTEHYARHVDSELLPSRASRVLDSWLLDRGHYWLAAPEGAGPFPLLVFLHGNAGPFQFYPQTLARAATESGFVVAFPSWGFGHWDRPAGYARVSEVVAAVAAELPIDEARVVVGGLSAGGMGALGAVAAAPERYHACLVISGVPPTELPSEPFLRRPLLVIHGARDQRVRVEPARELVERLRRAGSPPRYLELADADHFLLMTHEARALQEIQAWLDKLAAPR